MPNILVRTADLCNNRVHSRFGDATCKALTRPYGENGFEVSSELFDFAKIWEMSSSKDDEKQLIRGHQEWMIREKSPMKYPVKEPF